MSVPGAFQLAAEMAIIYELRSQEADSVTILCDNPEVPPNNAVVCNGDWTDWEDRRFEGDTLLNALQAAHQAYKAQT